MGMGSKFAIALLTVGCATTVFAAEVLKPTETKDFQKNAAMTSENGVLTVKGQTSIFSEKAVPVDTTKKYRLSGKFRAKDGTAPTTLFLGYAPLDDKGIPINSVMISPIQNTDTELAEAAKAGDTVLKIKDASKWNKQAKYGVVVFNTKADLSDLPNGDIANLVSDKIENKNGVWDVPLKTPLKKAYAKGTPVRQQTYAASYIYNAAAARKTSKDWQSFSGVISGQAKAGAVSNQWWPGTKSARVLILMNFGSKNGVTEFKDILVETVD